MFRSIFLKTLYERRLYIFAWVVGLFLITLFTMSFFPYFKDGNFDQVLQSLPKNLQGIVGNAGTSHTVNGYIGQQIYALRSPLFTIIMAITLFISLSAGDEERGTLQTLLTQPVSRTRVYFEKLLAGSFIIFLISLGIALGILAAPIFIHQSASMNVVIGTFAACYLITISFGVLAYALGTATGRRGLAMGLTSIIAIASYLINSLAPGVEKLQSADTFTIFHYYQPGETALHGLNWAHVGIQLAVIIILLLFSWSLFERRDMHNES